jgi:hypothetical protein
MLTCVGALTHKKPNLEYEKIYFLIPNFRATAPRLGIAVGYLAGASVCRLVHKIAKSDY